MDRAYAVLEIKALDDEQRLIEGLATTPTADRAGDVVHPEGASFNLPLPLLWQHDTNQPIGEVFAASVTPAGINIKARLARIAEPGRLKDRLDDAWQSIKAQPPLVRGLSIGFTPLGDIEPIKGTRGRRFRKWLWAELSAVTIPLNLEATIHTVKSLDLAASGRSSSGASDPLPVVRAVQAAPVMTIREQITQFENTRAAKAAQMAELMATAAAAGETLDAAQSERYDTLEAEVKSVDAHLSRLATHEKLQLITATRVEPTNGNGHEAASATRGANPVITVKANVPKGTAFVRTACATLVCHGNLHEAAEYAKRWDDSTPEVALYLKAAMAPGTTTDATWAQPLVSPGIAADFIDLLRAATILGRITGLREVPFNTKVPTQTAGGTYGWVGEAKPKPVTKLAFSATTLGYSKAAGIIVLTEELVRLSNPAAEDLARRDMIAGIARFLDTQFIDPAVAAVANVNPASITNGAPTAAATTNPLADIMGLINHFAVNNIDVDGVHFILSPANALSLSFRSNLDGSPQFPGVGLDGGTYRGLRFVVSNTAGANVIALQPNLILYADDGGVTIDASREASLQMDSAPMSPADATTVYVSLWQTNSVGLRAERWVNWLRANPNAVKYLTATAWPAPTGATGLQAAPEASREGRAATGK